MKIELPINITLGKRVIKHHPLNLNYYRNAHYMILNNMKAEFSNLIADKISALPKYKRITLAYTLYPKTHRLCDVSNICSIVDKFFCDELTKKGIIEDDNYTVLSEITYRFGAVDKDNPRVEVEINGELNEDHNCSNGN